MSNNNKRPFGQNSQREHAEQNQKPFQKQGQQQEERPYSKQGQSQRPEAEKTRYEKNEKDNYRGGHDQNRGSEHEKRGSENNRWKRDEE